MSRPNDGQKWRGKQPQPANRFKLSFRSRKSNFESYLYHQHTEPTVNVGASVAGPLGVQSGTQQLGNEIPGGDTQRSPKQTKSAGWKLFRSSKSHADGHNTAKSAPLGAGQQMSFRLPTSPEIFKGHAAYPPEITSPPRNAMSSLPYQSIANWETVRTPSCYGFRCPTDQCFRASVTGTDSYYSGQPMDDGLSFPEVDFTRSNNVAAFEEYSENARIASTLSSYGSQFNNCVLEPSVMPSRDLETQPYFEDAAYHVRDLQQLTGISITDWEQVGYCYEATVSGLMAAFARHKERGIPWNYSPSEYHSFDNDDFCHSSIPGACSQAPSRPSQDMALVFAEASRRLALYNKQWTLIQQRPTIAEAPAPSIPWPSRAPSFSRQDFYERNLEVRSSEELPKFTAHKFFCHAFGLHPIWNFQDDSGHGIRFDIRETKDTKAEKLSGLRNQLKLEKVRWHEDKMKAAFGENVANDECVKEVWAVVISLKNKVEQELEYLRVQAEGNETT